MTDHSEERRAILRIHAVWQRFAAHGLPSRSDLDAREFGADWSNCVIVPIAMNCAKAVGVSETDVDADSPRQRLARTLLPLAQRQIARVLATSQAVGYGGTASHEETDILYRIVLLPLSEDGVRIDALLVGLTHREIPPANELSVSDIAWCKSPSWSQPAAEAYPAANAARHVHKNGDNPSSP